MYWPTNSLRLFEHLSRVIDDIHQPYGIDCETRQFPKVNVWINTEGAIVTAEVPGIDPKDLELTVRDSVITISGEIPTDHKLDNEGYLKSERLTGKFKKEITLPFRINPDHLNADSKNGLIKLTLERAEEDKPKKITVKAA